MSIYILAISGLRDNSTILEEYLLMQVDRTNGNVMALSAVHLNTDVYLVCLTHALSTEKEEIMGLLIGDVSPIFFPLRK